MKNCTTMLSTALVAITVLSLAFMTPEVNAQQFRRHSHLAPHTTTHIDYYRHGNHVDAVPHTTTHLDRVTRNGFHSQQNYPQQNYPQQNYPQQNYPQQNYPQQNYPQQNYPQQSSRTGLRQSRTHVDLVPHTQTHIDYYRHGNHVDAVPHTQTHLDAVPHTTYGH